MPFADATTSSTPALDGDTLDALAWRNGFGPESLQSIARANPGIASKLYLEPGQSIFLPASEDPPQSGQPSRPAQGRPVSLWD